MQSRSKIPVLPCVKMSFFRIFSTSSYVGRQPKVPTGSQRSSRKVLSRWPGGNAALRICCFSNLWHWSLRTCRPRTGRIESRLSALGILWPTRNQARWNAGGHKHSDVMSVSQQGLEHVGTVGILRSGAWTGQAASQLHICRERAAGLCSLMMSHPQLWQIWQPLWGLNVLEMTTSPNNSAASTSPFWMANNFRWRRRFCARALRPDVAALDWHHSRARKLFAEPLQPLTRKKVSTILSPKKGMGCQTLARCFLLRPEMRIFQVVQATKLLWSTTLKTSSWGSWGDCWLIVF